MRAMRALNTPGIAIAPALQASRRPRPGWGRGDNDGVMYLSCLRLLVEFTLTHSRPAGRKEQSLAGGCSMFMQSRRQGATRVYLLLSLVLFALFGLLMTYELVNGDKFEANQDLL